MIKPTLWLVVKLSVWGAGLMAILNVGRLSLPAEHIVCGPWGCGPPLRALIACHGFWVVLLFPPMVMIVRRASARTARAIGLFCTVSGVTALIVIGIWQWMTWYVAVSAWERGYLVHRYLFSIATLVDVPVIEITVLGIAWLTAAAGTNGRRRSLESAASTNSTSGITSAREANGISGGWHGVNGR